ncbi:sugar kinase [Actinoplanes sp. TRM 88003]|uniref:Sugar kinase n=1 Tax=Paractinoplanes aksuensis TaxID=2939490 RepID=A0ABT1DH44_9ACTN|nr:sugar kinase [Actinoplanes aksuensis]MCO8270139.1 sugar kinase [Actinoplanes aksuensis]
MTTFDVVAVGETMALVTPDPPGPLALGGPARIDVAGAESTVASYLAQSGLRTAWVSRVGDDPFGELVRARLDGYGVDTSYVEVDGISATGVFFKDPGEATRVFYYRAGSAASKLGPGLRLPPARITHLSGITPALSSTCARLVDELLSTRLCSFDVNYRPRLWTTEQAGPVLRELANRAAVVFVGLDEAQTLWGVASPEDVRDLLPNPDVLVVKDGAIGATSFHPAGTDFEPAPAVDVIEPVGAGDAFAAGYLAGMSRGSSEAARLRLGHRVAGAALRVTGDVADLKEML